MASVVGCQQQAGNADDLDRAEHRGAIGLGDADLLAGEVPSGEPPSHRPVPRLQPGQPTSQFIRDVQQVRTCPRCRGKRLRLRVGRRANNAWRRTYREGAR
ncbi:hypothetical protein OG458_40775 [Streptomyces sp. NBC_01281]|uniref:hypothetical protein n=1 Tax=unclassified Streptomyces TaxID=2593676 RepID=UPI002E14D8AF|nr:hypothetical protein OG458_40775 [Streptomyces sp. NBC_01281]